MIVENRDGKLHIRIAGPWREVIMWEVPLLAVISEVVHRRRSAQVTPEQAVAHLQTKLAQFKTLAGDLDLSRFKLMDFGTRRRFSQGVQQAIVSTLQAEFPWAPAITILLTSSAWCRSARRRMNGSRRTSR